MDEGLSVAEDRPKWRIARKTGHKHNEAGSSRLRPRLLTRRSPVSNLLHSAPRVRHSSNQEFASFDAERAQHLHQIARKSWNPLRFRVVFTEVRMTTWHSGGCDRWPITTLLELEKSRAMLTRLHRSFGNRNPGRLGWFGRVGSLP